MRDRVLLLLLALLATTVVLDGCPPRLRSSSGDDDDSIDDDDATPSDDDDDDDDATPPDDDDDTPTDDDDDDDVVPVEPAQVTFSASLDLDCDGEVCALAFEAVVHYWLDLGAGLQDCEQHLVGAGEATEGFGLAPDCGNCTAGFTIDPASWVDVSDPDTDPDHCSVDALNANDNNYGEAFVSPAGSFEGAWGDFNQGVFMNADTHRALGSDYQADGGLGGDDLTATYEELGFVYAGLIFWDASIPGSSAEALAEAGLFVGEGDSDQFQPGWLVYFDPEENPLADPTEPTGWTGLHAASGTFLYNL